ncbi:hypothetical protein GCM10009425_24480 [Pseudomonas asuensis]|uniref:DUF4124 domain-containing protein n=1 Tax=Pseudomonas asuensis TaxID=1825787 RepID=A0ABQ2GUH2_9PSED|nr:DUF4124 domain-containing protein [Pseudomonas asuensis]GGM12639.1 hypothetical protein GCM10009425_24480 [Pseudomonas asuensis]
MKWAILAVTVSGLSGFAQADTILKCVDKAGQITFTQGRCPSGQSLADRIEVDNPPPSGSGPVTRMAAPMPPPEAEQPKVEPQAKTPKSTSRSTSDSDEYYERDDEYDYDASPPIRQDRYYPYPEPYYGGHRPPWHHYPRPNPPAPQPTPEPAPRPSVTERGRAAIEQKKAQVEAQKAERRRLMDQR